MRYHTVTLVAIFLALTIGILLGGSGGAWWEQSRQGMVETVLQRYQQTRQQNQQLQRELAAQKDHVKIRREENNRLFQEAVRHRLERRLILLVDSSYRGKNVEVALRKAGAVVERKSTFPRNFTQYDAIVVFAHRQLSDVRLAFDGPVVWCENRESDQPVLAAAGERVWQLPGEGKGHPERLVSMISWLSEMIQPKGEPL